mgnify:CR=1 FL=1
MDIWGLNILDLVIILLYIAVILWINARGTFMYLDNVAGGRLAALAVTRAIGGVGEVAIIDHPEVRIALHHSGSLLEWLVREEPGYLGDLRALVERSLLWSSSPGW